MPDVTPKGATANFGGKKDSDEDEFEQTISHGGDKDMPKVDESESFDVSVPSRGQWQPPAIA